MRGELLAGLLGGRESAADGWRMEEKRSEPDTVVSSAFAASEASVANFTHKSNRQGIWGPSRLQPRGFENKTRGVDGPSRSVRGMAAFGGPQSLSPSAAVLAAFYEIIGQMHPPRGLNRPGLTLVKLVASGS